MKRVLILTVLALLFAACSPAPDASDERTERLTAYFNAADSNNNGMLELVEINTEIYQDYADLDYNDDGIVTIEDIYNEEQALPEGVDPILELSHHLPYNQNGDDIITPEEYRSYLESELLDEIDSNNNDVINFQEYRDFHNF